ncbi:hypothetical protein MKX54_14025 [Alkalihalobacillus sp. FSL R5-0424]
MSAIVAWLTIVIIGTGGFVYLLAFLTGDLISALLIGVLIHTSVILAYKIGGNLNDKK